MEDVAGTRSDTVSRASIVASIVSMGIGLVWFSIPNVYVFSPSIGYMVEHPNWRGYPFMALAVLLPVFGAAFNRRERLRPSRLAFSSGLLMMGFFAAVVGVIAFFTAEVDESGGTVNISYPNPIGMPWIVSAAALWSVAGLMLRSRHLGESKIPAAIGLLVAGLVFPLPAPLLLGKTDLAPLDVRAVGQRSPFFG